MVRGVRVRYQSSYRSTANLRRCQNYHRDEFIRKTLNTRIFRTRDERDKIHRALISRDEGSKRKGRLSTRGCAALSIRNSVCAEATRAART